MKREYIIVADPNGAGKSALYRARPKLFAGSQRVNADEILRKNPRDRRDIADKGRAMKAVIRMTDANIHAAYPFTRKRPQQGHKRIHTRSYQ